MKRTILVTAFAFLMAACFSMTSCKGNKGGKSELDSIAEANKSLETQVEEMDELISSVLANFQEISAMEGVINVPANGEMNTSQKERVESSMQMIAVKLKANKEDIDRLNAKLQALGSKNAVMTKTIKALQTELESKTKEIRRLTEELQRKNIAIKDLDDMVNDLNQNVEALATTTEKQSETIASQDASLNTVRYCVGTKNDLKEMGILVNGKVATENYTSDYFRQVDLRKLARIPLYCKKAELLTNHPSSSYRLSPGDDKQLTLEIIDPQNFWSLSKVLVVRTY